MRLFHRLFFLSLAMLMFGCRSGDGGGATGEPSATEVQPTVAFITNQIADFWKIAEVGCLDAQKDFDVKVEVRMPTEATAVEQKRIVEDLITAGVDGIAISPIDADNQQDLVNSVAKQVPLITHDSDAPGTDRLMYIGMDNYRAGRMAGQLVKKALPEGGKIVIFIGRLEQDNAKHRRQGTIDELLDRPSDTSRFDPVEGVIEGEKYTILATLVDQGKQEVAKEKAADAINAYPDMNAMVGLFEYNPPACYQALQQANKLGEIKLIGFDENELTLQAIKDGTCVGTVVQNPYEYGYQSVKILASLIKGDKSVIPESKFIDIEARMITADNVDEFWADLKAKKGS
ncbi:MAG: substrate-binding domain-containing protein [Planctomycetales bacterium]|nr:substrate-binding domain-containing protein [Planctomycetales bacterium]